MLLFYFVLSSFLSIILMSFLEWSDLRTCYGSGCGLGIDERIFCFLPCDWFGWTLLRFLLSVFMFIFSTLLLFSWSKCCKSWFFILMKSLEFCLSPNPFLGIFSRSIKFLPFLLEFDDLSLVLGLCCYWAVSKLLLLMFFLTSSNESFTVALN